MDIEIQIDGLVGPTHHFAGLALGNQASAKHKGLCAFPRKAAKQGLEKMRRVLEHGVPQYFLGPQMRPDWGFLRHKGYQGSHSEIWSQLKHDPETLHQSLSSSFMWRANSATVSPWVDTVDGKTHLTVANLRSHSHRSIEAAASLEQLSQLIASSNIILHPPLPVEVYSDEGAANHMRLSEGPGLPGVEVFVCGSNETSEQRPERYPARQNRKTCERIIKDHALLSGAAYILKQNHLAIDAGVFHNDVIAMSAGNFLLCHEKAYENQEESLDQLRSYYLERTGKPLYVRVVSENELSLEDAVETYFFNSQILRLSDGSLFVLVPGECRREKSEKLILALLEENNAISGYEYVDLSESMGNGGGPACLRLRMEVTQEQLKNLDPAMRIQSPSKLDELHAWIEVFYPEKLEWHDLFDIRFIEQAEEAMNVLNDKMKNWRKCS